jgi:hypothetical protein
MSRDWQRWFLQQLLEKYERSKAFRESGEGQRKIRLDFSQKALPDYHFGDYQDKAEIKAAAENLDKIGLVSLEWVKGEAGNLIKDVALNLDKLAEAYRVAGVRSKDDEIGQFLAEISNLKQPLEILGLENAAAGWQKKAEGKKQLDAMLPRDEAVRSACLVALGNIAGLGNDTDERMFSLQCYGNSKLFSGSIKAGVARILRQSTRFPPEEDESDAETFERFGILEGGSDFRLAGPIWVGLGDGVLDFSPARGGLALSPDDVKEAVVANIAADNLLSVENLAVFREILRRGLQEKTILVYSGGFYSQRKLGFLRRIREAMLAKNPQARFFHWGDIDLGGLRILLHLKNAAIPELRPFRMSPEILDQYGAYCSDFDANYGMKLQRLQESCPADMEIILEAMLEGTVRLEQEAILCVGKEPVRLPE